MVHGAVRGRFQFGLRGLMALSVAVALGFSMLSVDSTGFGHALLAAASVWIFWGLVNQIRDLWAALHARADLSVEQRWGSWFAVFWRIGVMLLLVGYFLVYALEKRELIGLPELEDSWLGQGSALRQALLYLLLLIVLASIPRSARPRRQTQEPSLFSIAAVVVVLLLCMLLWFPERLRDLTTAVLACLVLVLGALRATEYRAASKHTRLLGGTAAVIAAVLTLYVWSPLLYLSLLIVWACVPFPPLEFPQTKEPPYSRIVAAVVALLTCVFVLVPERFDDVETALLAFLVFVLGALWVIESRSTSKRTRVMGRIAAAVATVCALYVWQPGLFFLLLIPLAVIHRRASSGPQPRRLRYFAIAAVAAAGLWCLLCWISGRPGNVGEILVVPWVLLLAVWEGTRSGQASKRSYLFSAIALAIAVPWCLYSWADVTLISSLVHIAVTGIAMAEPLSLSPETVHATAREHAFFWQSLPVLPVLLASCVGVWQLARQWPRGILRRLLWTALLLAGLAVMVNYVIWVHTTALPEVSPMLADAMRFGPLHRWITALLVVAILSAGIAYRLTAAGRDTESVEPLGCGYSPHRYHHQRRTIIVLVMLGTVSICVIEPLVLASSSVGYWALSGSGTSFFFLRPLVIFFSNMLYRPNYLPLAILLLGVQKLVASATQLPTPPAVCPPEMVPGQFCAAWLAAFVTIVLAVPTLAACGFAFWLGPW